MRVMRWEPFREMDDLLKGFTPLFGRLPARLAEGEHEFVPPADVIEREKDDLVKIDLLRAESRDGVLVVTLPRVAVEKPRPIAITIQ